MPWGCTVDLSYYSGRLYTGSGDVLNPVGWAQETPFPTLTRYQWVEIVEAASRAVFLAQDYYGSLFLRVYDLASREQLAQITLPTLSSREGSAGSLTQCGADRLAFLRDDSLFLVRNSQIPFNPPADLVLRGSVRPPTSTLGNPLQYTLTVSNAGPNAASNVVARLPLAAAFLLRPVAVDRGTNSLNDTYLDWNLGTLGRGEPALLSLTLTGAVVYRHIGLLSRGSWISGGRPEYQGSRRVSLSSGGRFSSGPMVCCPHPPDRGTGFRISGFPSRISPRGPVSQLRPGAGCRKWWWMRMDRQARVLLAAVALLVLCSVMVVRQINANRARHVELREAFILLHTRGYTNEAQRLYSHLLRDVPKLGNRALMEDFQRTLLLVDPTLRQPDNLIWDYHWYVSNELEKRSEDTLRRALKLANED